MKEGLKGAPAPFESAGRSRSSPLSIHNSASSTPSSRSGKIATAVGLARRCWATGLAFKMTTELAVEPSCHSLMFSARRRAHGIGCSGYEFPAFVFRPGAVVVIVVMFGILDDSHAWPPCRLLEILGLGASVVEGCVSRQGAKRKSFPELEGAGGWLAERDGP